MHRSFGGVVLFFCLAVALAIPASAQDLIFSANPPRVQVKANTLSPAGLPQCPTDDPTVPTTGILYCYAPRYIWTAYNTIPLYESGITGAGQTIVIIDAYGSPTIASDLQAFDSVFGLPDPQFDVVCVEGCPTLNPKNMPQAEVNWTFETSLDVQWAHAIAPGARIVLLVASTAHGDAINNALKYAVDHYPGTIISQSFGLAEAGIHGNNTQLMQAHQYYAEAAAKGITVLASAGDFGASNGGFPFATASYPASDPLVTGVGGTQGLPEGNLVTLAGSCPPSSSNPCFPVGYGAEAAWNETWAVSATGGAPSVLFAQPSYQAGLNFTTRAVPDVAYNAAIDGGVLVAYSALGPVQAGFYIVGGTSAGSPQWAGIFALTNQMRAANSKGPIGPANPALYSLANSSAYNLDFHDVTQGNNVLAGTTPGFSAGPGYDLTTGWGSPNVANLVSDLAAQ